MPRYDYKCNKCGVFEVEQRIVEEAIKICPTCAGLVDRLISPVSAHFKGSGFFCNDYKTSNNKPKSET